MPTTKIDDSIILSKLNISAAIAFIEDAIESEKATLTTNKLLNNEIEYLTSDYKITNGEILLSLLRRHNQF